MKHRTIEQLADEVASGQHDATIAEIADSLRLYPHPTTIEGTRQLVLAVVRSFLEAKRNKRTDIE